MLTLWHGSRLGLKGVIRPISMMDENNKYVPHDFGVGFYAGSKLSSAVDWVFRQANQATITKIVLNDPKALVNLGCKTHVFKSDIDGIIDWALYIAYSRNYFRKYTPIRKKESVRYRKIDDLYPLTFDYFAKLNECDIIIGPIADDRMQYAYSAFIDEWLGIRGLNEALKSAFLGTQFAFKTQKACNALNEHGMITTCKLSDFLRTDPRYRNRTHQQIARETVKKESSMKDRVTLINRRYRKSIDDYLPDILSAREEALRQSLETDSAKFRIENFSDLDYREL